MKRNGINILLTLGFGIVAIISFLILCFNLTSNEIVAITSALISLSGGGLVSVVVTWFINIDQRKREKKRKALIRDNVLLPTYNTLLGLLYNISRLCGLMNTELNNVKRTWKEWVDVLIVDIAESKNYDAKSKCLYSLYASINNMQNRIDEIRANRVNLLLEEMITNEEYYAFCELDFYLNKIKHEAINKNTKGVVYGLQEFSQQGEEILE